MNTHEGYSKKTISNANVLLAGGGDKALSNFIGGIQYVSASKKLQYKTSAENASWQDLPIPFSSYLTSHLSVTNNNPNIKFGNTMTIGKVGNTNLQITLSDNEGTSNFTDNTELLTSYASNNGFADTNAPGVIYRRDAIHMYNYIKAKLDSVYSTIHNHPYLPLSGGTMSLGEGLKFHSDDNYFGTNEDARIISLLDGNGSYCDGGLIIDERATSNGTETVTELLRIRHDEFKWKGLAIYHTGNLSLSTFGLTSRNIVAGGSNYTVTSPYNTNINLDSLYVTAVGNGSGSYINQLYYTKNGSNSYFTVNYATNATKLKPETSLNVNACSENLAMRLYYNLNNNNSYAGSDNSYGFPSNNNANGILWIPVHSSSYGGQLGISSNSYLYYRYISGGSFPTTTNGGSWNRIAWYSEIPTTMAWSSITSKPATATRWPTWDEVTGKPSTFTPSSHTHSVSQITWTGGANLTPTASANNQEWSIDLTPGTYTGTYWHVWRSSSEGISVSGTLLKVDSDTGKVSAPYGFVGSLTGNADTATKLKTARTINGTSFDGSLNITIAPSLLIDGNKIASKVGNLTSTYITVPYASNADKLDGYHYDVFLRKVTVANNTTNDFNTFENMTLTGRGDPTTGASLSNAPWTDKGPAGGYGVLTYLWSGYGTQMAWGYSSNRIYIRNKNYANHAATWLTTWDSLALSSDIPTVNNASLTLQVGGNTKTTFYANDNTNRTFNVTLADLGAAAEHSHPYLPLAGGTMNSGGQIIVGSITHSSGQNYSGGIQLRELNYSGGSLTDNYENAPGITFHWSTKYVHKLNLHANDIYWDNYKVLHTNNVSPSIGINGNTIRITVGGVNSSYITVPFATNSTYATYATHLNATNLNGASAWSWNPFSLTQYWCWGESFINSNTGSDSGDIRFYLASITSAGGAGLCMNIDGHIATLSKIYAGQGFIHGGYNSSSYLLRSDGGVKAVSDFATSGHNHDGRYMLIYGYVNNLDFNIADGGRASGIYYRNKDNATNTNAPTDYGLLTDFNSNAGHMQLYVPSGPLNKLQFRSYWWTGDSDFSGYPNWVTILHSGNSSVSGGGSTWGSSITVKINDVTKTLTIPSNPNTDYRVQLEETTTSYWRGVIFGYNTSSSANTGITGTVTNVVYTSNKLTFQPSTGNLSSKGNIVATSTSSSWLDGQRYNQGAYNLSDANDTGSYWPWMRQTNTGSSKWFSVGILNNSYYIMGSKTSKTDNGYDYCWRFDVSNGWAYGNFQNADTVDSQHFSYSNTSNSPTYLWGTNTSGTNFLVSRASMSVNYASSSGIATALLTNNSGQSADNCYDANPGLHFYRFNGTGNTIGGGDGWIMLWSWNLGSVGGQIYMDDNPSGIIGIRGCSGSSGTTPTGFSSWWRIYTDNYHPYADQIKTVTESGNDKRYLTFVDSDNTTAAYENLYTTGSIYYNPSTKSFGHGKSVNANGTCSTAEGAETTATSYSHAEGVLTNASGDTSHAEGYLTTASGLFAHAEGASNTASGWCSHVGGNGSTSLGDQSFAQGNNANSSGWASFAANSNTVASGNCSTAFGQDTQALHNHEFAIGNYNASDADTRFSVGGGTSDSNRLNLFEVKTDGTLKAGSNTILHTGNVSSSQSGNNITILYGGLSKTFTIPDASISHTRFNNTTTTYVLGTRMTGTGTLSEVYSVSLFYFTNAGAFHTSDARKKHDIRDIFDNDVTKLFNTNNGFLHHFKWNESNKDAYGFIAQELMEYCPEAVDFNSDTGYYSVNYNVAFSKVIGAMFKKIKELEKEIEILKNS